MRRLTALALCGALVPGLAEAATYVINIVDPLNLGQVATAATGDTVFRMAPSTGAVAVQSGSGRRISPGGVRAMVTVTCRPDRGVDPACQNNNISIRIGTIGGVTGRARALSGFTIAMGTASLATPPTGTSPLAFQIGPVGDNASKTFYVGADFPVAGDDSGLPSGSGENMFYANVVNNGGIVLAGDTDKGLLSAFRALAVAKTADLSFGRIQRPTAGTSTVALDAATGARTVSGTGVGYATPTATRAAFSITGEGGQQVSLSMPSSLTLTGPGTLNVDLTDTTPNAPVLSGGLGQAGTYAFSVGGSFTLSPTTPTGAYSGVLTVTVDYN
ncbi:MAG: DUF4402 domain-containing protein [Alphaproteobacteria bacterium]|nr:DUF4402 domain-containing protein [Alphaproteobacteria bacterium]MBU1513876.1 DUF4402 domain-containing protein [Alphaproteobacteria bacterium]MBU2094479.1 DUF4402 domain-containing protein [Alphaproteobacteria bacterium]MBU2149795.1 DUF4402 domain-containing protein [Alphaproteobacteria bacterium]MBU2307266.1 DUF4402 domain-containing protein [Alphaproteobacteria bacterium]